jgi:peptide/nickel transport system substrate-binding protein
MRIYLLAFSISFSILLHAQRTTYKVNVWLQGDADMLHPTNYSSADAGYLLNLMFQTLTEIDPVTQQQVPFLAKALPTIAYDKKAELTSYTYELKPGAKWDNGTSITANDVLFSFKFAKCPAIDDLVQRVYIKGIVDVIKYTNDPLKFTVVTKGKKMIDEYTVGMQYILPEYVYDEAKVLRNYSLEQLDKLENKPLPAELIAYGRKYNSELYQRDPNYIVGSGAYKLNKWVTGQYIELVKKKNWWAENLAATDGTTIFDAYPDTINYVIIVDANAAMLAYKAGYIDVMDGVKARNFSSMRATDSSSSFYSTASHSYSYLGINMKHPILQDVKVRQAIAHIADVDTYIKEISLGMAERTIGPFSPHKKNAYNDTITPYDYNIEKAQKLLAEAGWKDRDNNGILYKKTRGEKVPLELTLLTTWGNETTKNLFDILSRDAEKAGIKINLVQKEWTMFLQSTKIHDFDLYFGAWISSATPDNPRQIWHTSSYNGGSNYTGFGNAETDKLIEDIEQELDAEKRKHLYDKFQVAVHQQVPYVFLSVPQSKIVISNKFEAISSKC